MVDAEDDDPMDAARRELHEETGYDSDDLVALGAVAPNPAIQDNQCHMYLARNARRNGVQALDGAEEIDVMLVDLDDIPGLITGGQITHALVVVAFYLFDQYRRFGEGRRDEETEKRR
jgi:8-oxo-dGTP pyrophosphatase MutT (NUDIX family)